MPVVRNIRVIWSRPARTFSLLSSGTGLLQVEVTVLPDLRPGFHSRSLASGGCECLRGAGEIVVVRCRVLERGVPTSAVVEDLDVLEDRVRELDPRLPLLPVQQLDLHARPERLHHRIVQAIADGPERGQQARGADLLGEDPRCELDSVIRMNNPSRTWLPCSDGHVQGVDDQGGVLLGVDGPADDLAAASI